ncbi:MAG: hypothetical protein AAF487_04875 [Bacteroidota bacterium]
MNQRLLEIIQIFLIFKSTLIAVPVALMAVMVKVEVDKHIDVNGALLELMEGFNLNHQPISSETTLFFDFE